MLTKLKLETPLSPLEEERRRKDAAEQLEIGHPCQKDKVKMFFKKLRAFLRIVFSYFFVIFLCRSVLD
jgi:hypothetical protein